MNTMRAFIAIAITLTLIVTMLTACPAAPVPTPSPAKEPPRAEKLPYSWTEGVVLYTIELLKGEGYWGADSWDFYEVRVSYKNASHETTKWSLDVGGFKLRTDAGNVYGLEDGGLHGSELAPEEEDRDGFVAVVFKTHQGEVPTELWWYRGEGQQEEPDIIFELG